jgi:hypothetical protein
MIRATCLATALLTSLLVTTNVRTAHAEAPNPHATPVYVLSLSTDDVDDQADALTLALRSRAREAPGWSLLESPQSFQTLALALKCPRKPDATCLQRVADQLHADHYVWGTVAHKKGVPEVVAELHLWSRSRGDTQTTTSFSENLKDGSDPSLIKVASRAFGKLTASSASGTLVVHAGTGAGSVMVDGSVKARLEAGVGRVNVGEGSHTVEVRVSGFESPAQDTVIEPGGERELTFTLAPSQQSVEDVAASAAGSFPVGKVLGYGGLVVGAGLLAGAGVAGAVWFNDSSKSTNDRNQVPSSISDVCTTATSPQAEDACRLSKDAKNISTAGWVMGIAGAAIGVTGLVVLLSDHPKDERDRGASLDVLPSVGTKGGDVVLRLTF